MKNSISFTGRVDKDRRLTLNFNNNTITQMKGMEYVIGMGYRFKDLAMKFNFGGKLTKLKGDLDLHYWVLKQDSTKAKAQFTTADLPVGIE